MTIEGQSQGSVTVLLDGGGFSQTAFLVEANSVTVEDLTINGETNQSGEPTPSTTAWSPPTTGPASRFPATRFPPSLPTML